MTYCIIDKTPIGPETERFAAFLKRKYVCEKYGEKPGFDLGAVYGILKILGDNS